MARDDVRPGAVVCTGDWRVVRAAVVSFVALSLAIGGHMYGGGAPPAWQSFALVWAIAGVLSWALSGHRWTPRELTAVLIIVQAVMHMLCAFGPRATAMGPSMLTGHVLATAVSVGLLRYGEEAVWRIADALLLRTIAASSTVDEAWSAPDESPSPSWAYVPPSMARTLLTNTPLRAPPAAL